MTGPATDPDVRGLLRAAVEWRLLGLLFELPRGDWKARLVSVARETTDEDLLAAVRAAEREASEGLYHATFGPSGPVSLREAGYRETMNLGRFISQLSALYDSFAYRPDVREAPDHLAVELGFAAYLLVKQAYARTRDEADQAGITGDVLGHFIREHVRRVALPVAGALQGSPSEFLSRAAQALHRMCAEQGTGREGVHREDAKSGKENSGQEV